MAIPVLITQCLQRDFADPICAHEPMPNKLHVGREEARRLMGIDPASGPVAHFMSWARTQQPGALHIVHVRDWHDPGDPAQAGHLASFGTHCVRDTPGARFVTAVEQGHDPARERIAGCTGLNDFEGTNLRQILETIAGGPDCRNLRAGVIGVWTEAKVTFLLYDLKTRLGIDALATCSALTAGSSRSKHFQALDQLRDILGVPVFDSTGEFAQWLVPGGTGMAAPKLAVARGPRLEITGGGTLPDAGTDLVRYLYRDSSRVALTPLSGGFSGAQVFRAESHDTHGHQEAPSVAKIGPRKLISAERAAFERVENVLGNSAPSVRGFVDIGGHAGIKYSFASMGPGKVRTLKSLFEAHAPMERIGYTIGQVFTDVLGRFYAAARYERLPLLEHYGFDPKWAPRVAENIARTAPGQDTAAEIAFPRGYRAANPVRFYADFLARPPQTQGEYHFVSYVHGDLNGANILLDSRDNVWVIDFFHTGPGHALKDLVKLENDLLYIFTPLDNTADFAEALHLTQALRAVRDLRDALPETIDGVHNPALLRAWEVLRQLRGFAAGICREDRHPLQMSIALLRYAIHTLSFDESSPLQKLWALAAASGHAEDIMRYYRTSARMRVDWLPATALRTPGRLGITICPGRRDRNRDLATDLAALRESGVTRIVSLLTHEELEWAGVADLRLRAEHAGLKFHELPIRDQDTPALGEAQALTADIHTWLDTGEHVAIHCLAGLGRAGVIAACALTTAGLDARAAIREVRLARDPRAIESVEQERFVHTFAGSQS